MKRTRFAKIISAAGFGLMLTSTAAMAAQATTTLNVRSGPGANYRVVDTLRAGENVDVRRCANNGWCEISQRGRDGWVSSRYLTNDSNRGRNWDRGRGRDRDDRRWRRDRDRFDRDFSYGGRRYFYTDRPGVSIQFGTNGFGFSFGNTDRRYPDCIRRGGRVYCRR